MVPKDLGLEFEDESEEQERLKREEESKKKRESLHSNVDLEFEVPGMEAGGAPAAGTTAPKAARHAGSQQRSQSQQRPVQPQARSATGQNNVTPMSARQASAGGPSVVEAMGDIDIGSGRSYSETEVKALIRAAVAECKLEMIAEIASETKELEIKVTRVLGVLGAKAPPLKKELMQVQKLVQDHTKLSLKLITPEDKKKAA